MEPSRLVRGRCPSQRGVVNTLLGAFGACLVAALPSEAGAVSINFQTASAATPAGYLADTGLAFGNRGNGQSYGWSGTVSADARERNADPDKRRDTLIHMAKSGTFTWEIQLANGTYDVELTLGDPSYTDQVNSLLVENVTVTDPDGQDNFDSTTARVTVGDGRLTISPATGAVNPKICFVVITAVSTETTSAGSTTGGSGSGLAASYFNNRDMSGSAVLTRTDATVDFNWGTGSPGTGVNVDNFSVRWSGEVQAPVSGSYRFVTESDDGIRLRLDGTTLVNNWTDHAPTVDTSSSVSLNAGQKYPVTLEYYEAGGGAVARLRWITPGAQTAVTIPASQLFPSGSTTSTGTSTGSTTGSAPTITKVRFFPRSGYAYRMTGGRFTGSNSGETTDFVELARLGAEPQEGVWTEISFQNSVPYQWVKYEAPDNSHGNIAEIEFYAGPQRLQGTAFGTSGSWNNAGNTFDKALDGNTLTFFDAPLGNGAYVGIRVQGAAEVVAPPTASPAPGSYSAAVQVTLSSTTPGATIRFTLNGSNPTATSGTVYSGPFAINTSATLKAIATKSGSFDSSLFQGFYSIGTSTTSGYTSYHLGNSLTDTVNFHLDSIADSAGYNHTFLRSTIPGAPTDWLWDHPGESLGEPDYRVVFANRVIDQLFQQPFAGHARSIENESDYGGRFLNLCRQNSPNVQHWLYVQWPATGFTDAWSQATGSASGLGLTPATTWSQGAMNHRRYIEFIRQRMDDLYDGKAPLIVPAGTALADLKAAVEAGQVPGITDFFGRHFSDALHLSGDGQYMVSLVHFACMYRRSPEGIVTFAGTGLNAAQAQIYQRIAWDHVRNYQWSGSFGL